MEHERQNIEASLDQVSGGSVLECTEEATAYCHSGCGGAIVYRTEDGRRSFFCPKCRQQVKSFEMIPVTK